MPTTQLETAGPASPTELSAAAPQGESLPVTVIEPQDGWARLNLGEVWRYRDLLFLLVWRDFSAKYRQSVLGLGWALIGPVLTVFIYTIVFGRMAKFPSDGIPYPVFSYAALLPWMYFSGCLTGVSNSAVGGKHLLTKVYFPRLILPLTKVVGGLIDFGIRLGVLLLMMIWYGIVPNAGVLLLPVFLLMCALSSLAVGLWLTALSVKYRDVRQMVSFLVRMWQWLCPIVYSVSMVPEKWRLLYSLNPLVGVIEGFRWAMLGKAAPDWAMMGISASVMTALLLGGLFFFKRAEATFADVI